MAFAFICSVMPSRFPENQLPQVLRAPGRRRPDCSCRAIWRRAASRPNFSADEMSGRFAPFCTASAMAELARSARVPGQSALRDEGLKAMVDGDGDVVLCAFRHLAVMRCVATDWAGSSMSVADVPEHYAGTVGAMNTVRKSDAITAGDPARAAEILVRLSRRDDLPYHLPLGVNAVEGSIRQDESLLAQDRKWAAWWVGPRTSVSPTPSSSRQPRTTNAPPRGPPSCDSTAGMCNYRIKVVYGLTMSAVSVITGGAGGMGVATAKDCRQGPHRGAGRQPAGPAGCRGEAR